MTPQLGRSVVQVLVVRVDIRVVIYEAVVQVFFIYGVENLCLIVGIVGSKKKISV